MLITALIRVATANIDDATINEELNMDDCIEKQQYLAKDPWQNRLAPILDEISMIFLKLLSKVNMLSKGKT